MTVFRGLLPASGCLWEEPLRPVRVAFLMRKTTAPDGLVSDCPGLLPLLLLPYLTLRSSLMSLGPTSKATITVMMHSGSM